MYLNLFLYLLRTFPDELKFENVETARKIAGKNSLKLWCLNELTAGLTDEWKIESRVSLAHNRTETEFITSNIANDNSNNNWVCKLVWLALLFINSVNVMVCPVKFPFKYFIHN